MATPKKSAKAGKDKKAAGKAPPKKDKPKAAANHGDEPTIRVADLTLADLRAGFDYLQLTINPESITEEQLELLKAFIELDDTFAVVAKKVSTGGPRGP